MDLNFFRKIRVLDGGMGQELLARGVEANGTLWSVNALLQKKYHELVLNTHLDFIKSGAEVIVTTTFTARRKRLRENNIENKFEYLNKIAGEIALKTKKKFPNTLIAGGLPPQNFTYQADDRNEEEIKNNFQEQARILNPYIDFFYFDVLSSLKEIKCGIEAIKEFKKPYLIGIHISEGTRLPNGDKISDVKKIINNQLLGIMLSCVSPENFQQNLSELKSLRVPFGFKLNAYITTNTSYSENYLKSKTGNPAEVLGKRKDLTPENMGRFAGIFKNAGATIFGGCCETTPAHIKELSKLAKK
ncbi:homocysteine S-methyltransferase family protein [Pelagibacterales bacterium SAG-MED43]|nr:homocysteine S-methyltransferase family protein [Pelagibacterales bacterium SAG-MED43]